MANRPVKAGAHSAGPQREPAAAVAPAGPPSAVHHQGFPGSPGIPGNPRNQGQASPASSPPAATSHPARPASHASHASRASHAPRAARDTVAASTLAWLPYLVVLVAVVSGLYVAWQGSRYAGRGMGVVGCALLAGAVARLLLPPRYAGPLSSRGRALDVVVLAVLGAAVIGAAVWLP